VAKPPRPQGSLQGDSLQLRPESDRGGLGEQNLGIGALAKARERLVADDLVAREFDDRLEDRTEVAAFDDARDVITAAPSSVRSATSRPMTARPGRRTPRGPQYLGDGDLLD